MNDTKEPIAEDTIALAIETLTGDVRDFLLDRLRNFKKPWVAMTEDEQYSEINSAKEAADNLVRQTVRIIASEGRRCMTGDLEQITVKDGLKAVIKLSKFDPYRHELVDAQGQAVLIVVADSEPFSGERESALPEPDQSDLIASAESLKTDNVKPLR